jgi:hypothetical protein
MHTRTGGAVVVTVIVGAVVFGTAPTPAAAGAQVAPVPIVRPTSPLIDMPTSYPFQPELKVFPDDPNDASIARGVRPYDEIAPLLNDLMDASDRVSTQVVAESELGRDIYLVTVTAPETAAETAQQQQWRDEVKNDPTAAAVDTELRSHYKVPVWFNGNIHGNEWEGSDAILNYVSELATSSDPAVTEMLSERRLYFTVTNNPDGRVLGWRGTWNGYDPNRDFITGATSEASVTRDLSAIIQPTYFVDLHGYADVLQVEPCGPPHGENYEYDLFVPHAYATALAIEKAVTDADIPGNTYLDRSTGWVTDQNTGNIRIPFRDYRQGWDDWPPIFAPQYVAYQGAITNTVELPLGRWGDEPAHAKTNIEVAHVVLDTVVDYVGEHAAALLENQIEIFRRGLAGEPSTVIPADIAPSDLAPGVPTQWTDIWDETDVYNADFPRAYVIPLGAGQRSDSDAQTLVQQLLVNGVRVERLTAPLTVGDTTYPTGSFYIDMHQPVRGLANVLLADGDDISARVPSMYDISAWSLALLWGADVDRIGETTDPAPTTAVEPVTAAPLTGSIPDAQSYLAFEPRGEDDYQAVNALLNAGIPVSQLSDGTIVLGPDGATREVATQLAASFGVDFTSVDGREIRDGDSTALRRVRVGFVGGSFERDALRALGFTDAVEVSTWNVSSGDVDLDDIDLLYVGGWIGFDTNDPVQAVGDQRMREYVAAGKPIVGNGLGAAALVNTYVTPLVGVEGSWGSNGIARVDTPADGVLGDYPQDTAFGYPFAWFRDLGAGITVEQRYTATDMFVAGHWSPWGLTPADAQGQASAVSLTGSTGTRAFVFGTNPTFRAHPIGAYSDMARAIFWAAGQGTPVAPPASVIEADLVDGTRGSVSLPETAVPGETVTVELGSDLTDAEPSALVFPGGSSLPLSDVTATSARLTIPADAEPGARRVAIVRGDGSLYGWDDLRVAAPGPTPEPTVSPEPTASPEPTVSPEPSASAQPTGGLAATGGAGTGQLGWGALAVGLIGLGTILIARARTTSRSS